MAKILIVEDNQKKLEKIKEFLLQEYPLYKFDEKLSYNSASRQIILHHTEYDLILLDMSMQTYDISSNEAGGDAEPLAGKNILKQMYLREIPTRVIVVTMYENFVDGTKIKKLDEELRNLYPENYCGYIFFTHDNRDWTIDLRNAINNILND